MPKIFKKSFQFLEHNNLLLPQAKINASQFLQKKQDILNQGADFLKQDMLTGGLSLPKLIEFAHHWQHNESIEDFQPRLVIKQFFETHRYFREPEIWELLYARASDQQQKELRELNAKWMRHAQYSHFSPKGLLKVAQYMERSRVALSQLKQAVSQYSAYKKKHKALSNYLDYLNKYEKILNAHQRCIAEALNARILLTLEANNLNATDLLNHLLQEIQGINPQAVLPQSMPFENPLPLASVYDYCIKKGSSFLRDSLKNTLCLGQDNSLIAIKKEKELVLVPQSLASSLPQKSGFLIRFSPNHKLLYQFFKTQQQLLFKMAAMHSPSTKPPSWFFDDVKWQALQEIGSELNKALSQTDLLPFNKKTTEFITYWKTLLIEQAKEVILYKYQYLHRLAKIEKPLSWSNANAVEQEKLTWIIEQMDTEISYLNEANNAAWRILKIKLLRPNLSSNTLDLLNKAIAHLQENTLLTDESLIELRLISMEDKSSFKAHYEEYLDCIQHILLQQLTDLEQSIGYIKDARTINLIQQGLILLEYLSKRMDTNPDLSTFYPILLSACKTYKKVSKQLTREEVQNKNFTELTTLLTQLAFSNPTWIGLHHLISGAKEYQQAILEGKKPQTNAEIIQSTRQFIFQAATHAKKYCPSRAPNDLNWY